MANPFLTPEKGVIDGGSELKDFEVEVEWYFTLANPDQEDPSHCVICDEGHDDHLSLPRIYEYSSATRDFAVN